MSKIYWAVEVFENWGDVLDVIHVWEEPDQHPDIILARAVEQYFETGGDPEAVEFRVRGEAWN